jgi:Protein of unknown function (DUF998)
MVNFLLTGFLIFLFAFDFRKATPLLKDSLWTSRLIAAAGFGLFGAGLFSSDRVYASR